MRFFLPFFSAVGSVPGRPGAAPPPSRAVRRLELRLYVYAGLKDLVLLYPVYALLFAENGLDTAEISSLFVLWSLTGLLAEVPSGVWADTVSRRLPLVVGALMTGAGFALWTLLPSYPAFAAGFVLWGLGGALGSGALEALVYEELERLGETARYPGLMGRTAAALTLATAVATALATPVFAVGGFLALGLASTAVCVLCALAAAVLPEHRESRAAAGDEGDGRGYRATLRAGLGEVRRVPAVRSALLTVVVVTSVWGALDEYVPLLAAATGAAIRDVPLLVLCVYAGVALGGVLASRAGGIAPVRAAALLGAASVLLAAGGLSGTPAGFVLLAPAFLVFQLIDVVADARLQDALPGSARATVTSLAGLGSEASTLVVYGVYGAAAGFTGHGVLFALFASVYAVAAAGFAVRGRAGGRGAVPE